MKVHLIFIDSEPLFAVYSLEGKCVQMYGRTEHIVSKDPWVDTLSTWLYFFIARKGTYWEVGYKSNRQYTKPELQIICNLINKANQAMTQRQPTELSQEFTALEQIEPFAFGGVYRQMNEHDEPIDKMREKLRNSMTLEEIEADEQLKDWLNGTFKTILVDLTDGSPDQR